MNYRFSGVLVRYIAKSPAPAPCCYQAAALPGAPVEARSETETPPARDQALSQAPTEQSAASAAAASPQPSGALAKTSVGVDGIESNDKAAAKSRSPSDDQLHVNLWELEREPFLDIGVMIGDWKNIAGIQVDLPWEVAPRDVSDLSSLMNSDKMVAAIFNEVVDYHAQADRPYAEISFNVQHPPGVSAKVQQEPDRFLLVRLNGNLFDVKPVLLSDGMAGSRIVVTLPRDLDQAAKRVYVRFRVRAVPADVYSSPFNQRDRNLLSSSMETRIIDFRINVRRGVPDEILSGDTQVWFPDFRKIHFFLTVTQSEICEFEGQDFVGCRSLVDEREWNHYANSKVDGSTHPHSNVRNYLGYQWTAKDGKSLGILGRFTRHRSNVLQIIRFVTLGLIFGMTGAALWDIVKPPVEQAPSKVLITRVIANHDEIYMVGGFLLFAVLLMVQIELYKRAWQWLIGFRKAVLRSTH